MRRQLPLPWPTDAPATSEVCEFQTTSTPPPLVSVFVRNGRARRYILRVLPDARVRVTIPRYGSRREAEAFLRTRLDWIADRRRELGAVTVDHRWAAGTRIWWRGTLQPVSVSGAADPLVIVRCGDIAVQVPTADDYRAALERAMRRVATIELPRQLLLLASRHGLDVAGVSVRNQRARWGSCSRDGRIALNWRLLQMPDAVRDYILLHELMHLREHNHSPRFWALVEAVCPGHLDARRWLRHEGLLLC